MVFERNNGSRVGNICGRTRNSSILLSASTKWSSLNHHSFLTTLSLLLTALRNPPFLPYFVQPPQPIESNAHTMPIPLHFLAFESSLVSWCQGRGRSQKLICINITTCRSKDGANVALFISLIVLCPVTSSGTIERKMCNGPFTRTPDSDLRTDMLILDERTYAVLC